MLWFLLVEEIVLIIQNPSRMLTFFEDSPHPLPSATQAITSTSECQGTSGTSLRAPTNYHFIYLLLGGVSHWEAEIKSSLQTCQVVGAQLVNAWMIDVSLQGFPPNFLVQFFKGL